MANLHDTGTLHVSVDPSKTINKILSEFVGSLISFVTKFYEIYLQIRKLREATFPLFYSTIFCNQIYLFC